MDAEKYGFGACNDFPALSGGSDGAIALLADQRLTHLGATDAVGGGRTNSVFLSVTYSYFSDFFEPSRPLVAESSLENPSLTQDPGCEDDFAGAAQLPVPGCGPLEPFAQLGFSWGSSRSGWPRLVSEYGAGSFEVASLKLDFEDLPKVDLPAARSIFCAKEPFDRPLLAQPPLSVMSKSP
ncbi:MAG: hypothetical protein V2I43_09780 [Parvularcula sp.]|jgi:hypothetical protein|nr:hypothetical protein [Parvularcula sp.]